jgi:hypothetical protein
VSGALTACTTSLLLPGLPLCCTGLARTNLPEKLQALLLLGAHGTASLLPAACLWLAASMISFDQAVQIRLLVYLIDAQCYLYACVYAPTQERLGPGVVPIQQQPIGSLTTANNPLRFKNNLARRSAHLRPKTPEQSHRSLLI